MITTNENRRLWNEKEYGEEQLEGAIREIFPTMKTLLEKGKRTLYENDEEEHRENLPCDKDYGLSYQS